MITVFDLILLYALAGFLWGYALFADHGQPTHNYTFNIRNKAEAEEPKLNSIIKQAKKNLKKLEGNA